MGRGMAMAGATYGIWFALFAVLCVVAAADAATVPPPPADCSVPFNNLTPCIDFVNSNSSGSPSAGCCSAFSTTQRQHPECLCQLQQAFADPATAPGNVTRASEIPSLCKVAVDYNKCPALLGLAPQAAPAPPTHAPVAPPLHAPVSLPALAPVQPSQAPVPGPAPPTGKDYDCTNSFNDLSSCLGFVSGDGKGEPPKTCCTAIGTTQAKEPICLCQLLAQVNDSAQYGVNATLAKELPTLCHVTADTSRCSALLDSPLAPSPSAAPVHSPSPMVTPAHPPSPVSPIVPAPAHAPVPVPPPVASPAPAPGPVGEAVDCSNEFALLQSCFAYVMANDTTPPSVECCTSLGSVVTNKPVCLCQLLQTVGSGDPATTGINATRALGLADMCSVTTDVSKCPALLGQPVSSPLPSSPLTGEAPGVSPAGGDGGETPVGEAPSGQALAPSKSVVVTSVSRSALLVAIFWSIAVTS